MLKNWIPSIRIKRKISPKVVDHSNDDAEAREHLLTNGTRPLSKPVLTKINLFILLAAGTLLGISLTTVYFTLVTRCAIAQGKNGTVKQSSYWSPILDDIEIKMRTTVLNGTIWPLPDPSFTREPPSIENDAMWETLAKPRAFPLTREDVVRLGKDPDKVTKFDDAYWGLGDDAYMAELDVRHEIHCLNMLRKQAFANYPGYNQAGMDDPYSEEWWIHLNHCVDMLLQSIKCNGNTDFYTLAWVQGRQQPWPDFNIKRKCRDFSAIEKWDQAHAADESKFSDLPLPKGAYVWPAPWLQQSELGHPIGKHRWRSGYEFNEAPAGMK